MSTHQIAKQLQTEELQFFRFNSSQICTETFFHRISLMARVSTLGPSVAPCPVEASTVHGEAFIWVKSLCSTISKILGFFFSAPKSRDNLTMKMAPFPVMTGSTSILDPLTQSRRSRTTTTSHTSTKELGFHLVGLFLNFGPSSKLWHSTKNSGFKSQTTRPRSALSCPLLSPTQLISRFFIISGRRLHQRWKSDSLHWPCYYHPRTLYSRSVRASKRLSNLMYSSQSQAKSGCPMFFTTDVSEAAARNFSKLLCDIDMNQGALVLFSSSMERSLSSTSSSMERTLLLLSSLMERTLLLHSSLMERSLSSTSSFMERTIPLNSSFMESVFKSSALIAPRAQISVCSPSLAEKHLKTFFKLIKSEASLLESTRDFICLSIFFYVYVFLIHFVISENYRASSSLAKNLLMTIVTPS